MAKSPRLLRAEDFAHHIGRFNAMEPETVVNAIPNSGAWDWMTKNIPFWGCSDPGLEEMYYFRWWTYRKHLKQTPAGLVITEFLTPVKHAGAFNTISCALGHHVAEDDGSTILAAWTSICVSGFGERGVSRSLTSTGSAAGRPWQFGSAFW